MKLSIHAQEEFIEVRSKLIHALDIIEKLESMYHRDKDTSQEAIVQALQKQIIDTLTNVSEIRSFEDGLKLYTLLEVAKNTIHNLV